MKGLPPNTKQFFVYLNNWGFFCQPAASPWRVCVGGEGRDKTEKIRQEKGNLTYCLKKFCMSNPESSAMPLSIS